MSEKALEERIKEIEDQLLLISKSINVLLSKNIDDNNIKIFIKLCEIMKSINHSKDNKNLVVVEKFKNLNWTDLNIKNNICYMNELMRLLGLMEYEIFNKDVINYYKIINIEEKNEEKKQKKQEKQKQLEEMREKMKEEMKEEMKEIKEEKKINDRLFQEIKIELFFDILINGLDEDTKKELMKLILIEKKIRYYYTDDYKDIRSYYFSLKWKKQSLKNNIINILEKMRLKNSPYYEELKKIFEEIDNNDYSNFNELNNFGYIQLK